MQHRILVGNVSAMLLAAMSAGLAARSAQALPAFARQTGQECATCHIGAFGPQLTPFGMRFKIKGYTDADGKAGHMPLSGHARVSSTSTAKDLPATDVGHGKANHNTDLDEASIFLAGRLADHIGSFIQVTHDGVAHANGLDHADLRVTGTTQLAKERAVVGVSVNNNPTVQDPFNTLPVWGFPFASSGHGLDTGASFVGLGGFEHQVLGATGYAFWGDRLYGELGTYRTLSPSMQSRLGVGRSDDHLGGNTYWRLAYTQNSGTQNWSAGLLGYKGTLHNRADGSTTHHFKDLGIDGSYQFLGTRKHIGTLDASYICENDSGVSTDAIPSQREFKIHASYHYLNTWGGTLGWFLNRTTHGDNDLKGYIVQADWTPWGKEDSWNAPWANVRVGLQYVGYTRFQGGSTYIDSEGNTRRASDNNTMYLFAWTAF